MAAGGDKNTGPSRTTTPGAEKRAATRGPLCVPLRCQYDSILDFVDTQSMNISRTGMFIETSAPPALGCQVDFEFGLADGFTLLKGQARVVRVVTGGPVTGMGVEFVVLEEPMRRLIERIVEVNAEEGRSSTLSLDFSRPAPVPPSVEPVAPRQAASAAVSFTDTDLRIVLSLETVAYFTTNPLLNVRLGGFFLPAEDNPPLGTVFAVTIVDPRGAVIVTAKGKVVAKQDVRVGIRLADIEKDGLARLRSEVAKLTAGK